MNIAECYRLLELSSTANLHEIKASYRRLARQWHPDVNPDNHQAHDMFIRVTQAYKVLLKVVPSVPKTTAASVQSQAQPQYSASPAAESSPSKVKVSVRKPYPQQPPQTPPSRPRAHAAAQRRTGTGGTPPSSPSPTQAHQKVNGTTPSPTLHNQKLKYDSYRQLQDLIKHKRFPRAVALVEALRQRLPEDLEIRQWQAIIYQSWGRQLIRERRFDQARAYLKKALNTDPHNKSLWAEVERDFQTLEKVY